MALTEEVVAYTFRILTEIDCDFLAYLDLTDTHNLLSAFLTNTTMHNFVMQSDEMQIYYIMLLTKWIEEQKESIDDDDDDDDIYTTDRDKEERNKRAKERQKNQGKSDSAPNRKRAIDCDGSNEENPIKRRKLDTMNNHAPGQKSGYSAARDAAEPFIEMFKKVRSGEIKILGPEQSLVIRDIRKGENVFVTGGGGVGKSFIIKTLKKMYGKGVCVVAPTGVAAKNVQGETLHSFFRLFIDHKQAYHQIKRTKHPLLEAKVLIVDEISMVGASTLQKSSDYSSYFRSMHDKIHTNMDHLTKPFGIQVVLFGDFLQLPPVKDSYCFSAPCWEQLELNYHVLRTNYRQSKDTEWRDMLNKIRVGEVTDEIIQNLNSRYIKNPKIPKFLPAEEKRIIEEAVKPIVGKMPEVSDYPDEDDLQFLEDMVSMEVAEWKNNYDKAVEDCKEKLGLYIDTKQIDISSIINLTTKNETADEINMREMKALKSQSVIFESKDTIHHGGRNSVMAATADDDKYFKDCKFEKRLELKVGARVMLLFNMNRTLTNGSIGTIKSIEQSPPVVRVLFDGVEFECDIVPTKWTTTKGAGEENETKEERRRREAQSLANQPSILDTIKKMRDIKLAQGDDDEFNNWNTNIHTPKSKASRNMIQKLKEDMTNMLHNTYEAPRRQRMLNGTIYIREQIPLIPAWAISIHKSQGLTLKQALVDTKNCFDAGQAYVAYSRVETFSGLYLINPITRRSIKASKDVLDFYKSKNITF